MSGALTWREGETTRARGVSRDGSTTIGRADEAVVRVDHPSVSREQAAIDFDGTSFVLRNLSRTNPTRVNGRPADETVLRDGDTLLLGAAELRFHDLGAHDTISGPVCSHCGRENNATDRDCWYCGTSLVSAASTLRARRPVVGRIVAESGEFVDLFDGQSATLAGGPPSLRQAPPERALEHAGGAPATEVEATADGLRLAAGVGDDGRRLSTGDIVEAGGARYVVIVR